jgi:molybdopterin-guanine dinucleotide biosynthesis protein
MTESRATRLNRSIVIRISWIISLSEKMRPRIIGIGGSGSGAGKTTIACKILESFRGWGAIKYTKTSFYSSITDDPDMLRKEGKDTKRFLDSGAEKVLWVQSPFSELDEVLPLALEMLSSVEGIVAEGNSLIEILKPDVVIFASGADGKIKSGAERILRMSDIIISGGDSPPEIPKDAKNFHRDDVDEYLHHIKTALASGLS